MYEQTFLNFAHLLRHGGLAVSYSEIEDALKAIAHFGVAKEEIFYTVLAASLCKDQGDRPLFDTAYRLFFFKQAPSLPLLPAATCDGEDGGEPATGGAMTAAASTFYGALLKRDPLTLHDQLTAALADTDEAADIDHLLHQVKVKLGWFMTAHALEQRQDSHLWQQTLADLEQYLRQSLERRLCQRAGSTAVIDQYNLAAKDLAALNEEEIRAMEKRLARLGRQLAARYSYRLQPAKHGFINMRKLLAETAKQGYPPAKPKRLAKRRDRPSLVVLCDISGSVACYSAFLMQLLCAMARRFQQLRIFLFVDDVAEVTAVLRERNPAAAVAGAIAASHLPRTGDSAQHCSHTGISDYGKVLTRFRRQHGAILDKKTTLLILGDARNNWFSPQRGEMALLAQMVKDIVWFNPEPQERWDREDSVISVYAPFCRTVQSCGNLQQLKDAINQIL